MKKEVREGYKMTDLGEIPNKWSVKKLKDVGYSVIGLTYSPDDLVGKEDGILVLRSSNIKNSRISYDDNKYVNKIIAEKQIVKKDDILICSRNGSKELIGKCAIIDEKAEGSSFGAFMTVFRSDYNKYLFHVFNSYLFKRQIYNNIGATINQITTDNLNNFKVIIPTNDEQEKISLILSTIDAQIDNTEKLIQKNQELKKGLMQQLLTKGIGHTEFKKTELGNIPKEWEIVKFDSVIELLTDYEANGSFSSIKENVNIYNEKNYAYFVRATDLEKKDYINSVKYVDEKSYEFLSKTELKGGELLISKRGQIGKVYLMPNLNIKCTLAPNLYLIKLLNDKVDNSYMYHYFTSSRGQKLLVRNSASTTLGAIYKEDLKKINILLPTIDEQRRISRILSNVEGKILNNQNKKEKLEELKKGLMQRLLTGYIRVI
ncbi:restriction endonuclease subunit S [Clostridium perfringens]